MTEHPAVTFFHLNRSLKKRKPNPAISNIVDMLFEQRMAAMSDKPLDQLSDQELREELDRYEVETPEHERLIEEAARRELDL